MTIDGDSLLHHGNGYGYMENSLSDDTVVYEWSIKIEKTDDTDQYINIGIASYPFSKDVGECCDASYDHRNGLKSSIRNNFDVIQC